MSVERPSKSAIIGRLFVESFVPGLRKRRVRSSEETPRQVTERAEHARNNLNSAWSALGDEIGENVTLEQIRAVINAELEVLTTSPPSTIQPLFVSNDFLESALKLHTLTGLVCAEAFMFSKADFWRDVAYKNAVEESISGNNLEAQRRVIASVSSQRLLFSMFSNLDKN